MPTSQSRKSPLGTNGPGEIPESPPSLEKSSRKEEKKSDPSPDTAAPVAEDSGKPKPEFQTDQVFLSQQDLKLSRYMNRTIAKRLGLNARSRSVRM
jgi:hypothetical protein